MNDAYFAFDPDAYYWIDLPASYHNGACGLAIADGHSEIKQWRFPSTRRAVQLKNPWPGLFDVIPIAERGDYDWLKRTYFHFDRKNRSNGVKRVGQSRSCSE